MQCLFEQIFMYINKLSVDNLKHDKLVYDSLYLRS